MRLGGELLGRGAGASGHRLAALPRTGSESSVVGLGLCIVRRIEKLHQVRSVLCLDDEEDDNAAPMLIPHGSFDLMGIFR